MGSRFRVWALGLAPLGIAGALSLNADADLTKASGPAPACSGRFARLLRKGGATAAVAVGGYFTFDVFNPREKQTPSVAPQLLDFFESSQAPRPAPPAATDETTPAPPLLNFQESAKPPPSLPIPSLDKIQACLDGASKPTSQSNPAPPRAAPSKKKPAPLNASRNFYPVNPSELPAGDEDGNLADMRLALQRQVEHCQKLPQSRLSSRTFRFGCLSVTEKEWCIDAGTQMLDVARSATNFRDFLIAARPLFNWYRSVGRSKPTSDGEIKKGEFQFTGYYAMPPLDASSVPTAEYKYAIYGTPPDLASGASCGGKYKYCRKSGDGSPSPYPDRKAIMVDQVLAGRGLELAYVRDPLDIVFLGIEGSGAVRFNDVVDEHGQPRVQRLNYDSQNGRKRNMLAKIIRCAGAQEKDWRSETTIRRWMYAHRDSIMDLINLDQSYVFYKKGTEGPFGVEDIPITPRHSMATDLKYIPTGTVMLFNLPRPSRLASAGQGLRITSMAISQDTGGAIVKEHGDWYLGADEQAKAIGDDINLGGSLFVALPKGAGTPVKGCHEFRFPDLRPQKKAY